MNETSAQEFVDLLISNADSQSGDLRAQLEQHREWLVSMCCESADDYVERWNGDD